MHFSPEEHQKKEDRRKCYQKRTTYFCANFTKILAKPISVLLREKVAKHNLTWLQPKMSHRKFMNLGEMFDEDLMLKVMEDIVNKFVQPT